MKKKILGILIPVLIFLTGLGVLLYPVFSDLWNQHRQNRLMTDYTNTVTDMEDAERNALWSAAVQYNQGLQAAPQDAFTGADPGPKNPYWSLLDPDGTGVMGYLEIPKISLRLPIYHGTGDAALQKGIGHLAGTSLPVGGSGTHCVLSGHRGLPSALLFTDLDQLETGDTFTLYVLDQRLSYQVDQILVVEPEDVSALAPEDGKDYVTLVTCTPYGCSPFNDYLPLLFASLPPKASLTPSATSAAASPTPSTTSPAASPTSLTASPAALPALSTSFETLLLSFLFSLFVFTVDSGDGEVLSFVLFIPHDVSIAAAINDNKINFIPFIFMPPLFINIALVLSLFLIL